MSRPISHSRFSPRIHLIFWLTGLLISLVHSGGFLTLGHRTLRSYETAAQQHHVSLEILSLYESLGDTEWSLLDPEGLDSLQKTIDRLKELEPSKRPQEIEKKVRSLRERPLPEMVLSLENLTLAGHTEAEDRVQRQTEAFLKISRDWVYKVWVMIFGGVVLLWILSSLLSLAFVHPLLHLSSIVEKLSHGDLSADFEKTLESRPYLYWVVPREILQLWLRMNVLMKKIARSRDEDFQRLQSEKKRAEDLAAALSDGVFFIEAGEISSMNPAGKRILDSDPSVLQRLIDVLSTGIETSLEVTFFDGLQRGSFVLRRVGGQTTQDAQEYRSNSASLNVSGVVIAQDITRIRESERSKSHFLGLLSHEIRTPVTSLVMAIRLLEKNHKNLEGLLQQKLIQTCSRDVERLRELLDDLLSISRFESTAHAGPIALSLRNSDLKKILRNAEESFRSEATKKGIRLESQMGESGRVEGEWICQVDTSKMGWALSNLVNNAIRHTSRGGEVRVSLRRSQSADGRRFFEYRVQDSGNGIPPDQMKKIMEPYSGVYDLRVARTELTGSSLSIARQIAEAHGGSLRVCSAPGHGSEFQLRFPSKERSQDGKVACG